ncbi:MAG TPA: AI-2E family transporter [Rectinemataceae bacterium]
MNQGRTKRLIFLMFFLALFLLMARLFYPFLTVILWSGLIYALLEKPFELLTSRMIPNPRSGRKRSIGKNLLAGLFSILGVLVFVVPFSYLFVSLIRQVVDLLGSAVRFVEERHDIFSLSLTSPVGSFVYRVSAGSIDLSGIDIPREIKSFIVASSNRIVGFSGTMIKNALSLVLTLAFMVFTLFFLFVDGKHLMSIIVKAMPIENDITRMFLQKMKDSGRQLIVGFFLVALYQGFAMFVISSLFGLKNALVLGTLTGIASFVPMVGTGLVWGPMAVYLFMAGDVLKALLFLALAAFFVAFMDNFLKPIILGERLRIHPLMIFFSILGGINIFGLNGLILGPLVVTVFFAAVELFEQIDLRGGSNPQSDESGDEAIAEDNSEK